MTTVNSVFSLKSTSSPATAFHSNSLTKLATKYSRCSIAGPNPAQTLLPTPNGIILIALLPVTSTPCPAPPSKNRSGLNSSGSSHTPSSHPISATIKFTVAPFGMSYPASVTSSDTACGSTKCAGGCRRSPSITTAFRYGILWRSSSLTSSASLPATAATSCHSLSCTSWFLTSSAMIH
ncbi:hypothetical protein MUK42_06748 [Musa troglodytarum]|uniref:Uncharacterized protein n=1 Tax=Musa troglodytarum TaxID=320322 RepID=A0A9E7ENJ3_9LILI|nr:hypothetical protein MUK42_06748 [Musa troglodytarum]